MKFFRKIFETLRAPALGVALCLIVCTLLLVLLGESPGLLWEAIHNTLFTGFGLGYTLFYSTPLIFTGLAVALSFHCGLFNIGAEGQLYLGAAAIIALGSLFPGLSSCLAIPLSVLVAGFAGGIWGGIAGFLKAKRGTHEVIVTILMNFISISLVDYLILYPYKNQDVQNPETITLGENYFWRPLSETFSSLGLDLFKTTPVNTVFFLALGLAILSYFFLFRTTQGFEMRAVGMNPKASRFAGISVSRNTILAFFLSGASAGLVGVNEINGYQHKLVEGFSPEYGFTGIAVALMARNHPIGIIFSAILFGALHNSSRELEFLSERVTKEVSLVLEATLIAFIASHYLIDKFYRRKKKDKAHA